MRAAILALVLACVALATAKAHESLPVYLGITETSAGS